jgi:hypothetical protein
MEITARQLINPGILKMDEERIKAISRFKDAVHRSKFLNANEKRHWVLLSYLLNGDQLMEGQKLIINEDLRQLRMAQKIEIISSKEK